MYNLFGVLEVVRTPDLSLRRPLITFLFNLKVYIKFRFMLYLSTFLYILILTTQQIIRIFSPDFVHFL